MLEPRCMLEMTSKNHLICHESSSGDSLHDMGELRKLYSSPRSEISCHVIVLQMHIDFEWVVSSVL